MEALQNPLPPKEPAARESLPTANSSLLWTRMAQSGFTQLQDTRQNAYRAGKRETCRSAGAKTKNSSMSRVPIIFPSESSVLIWSAEDETLFVNSRLEIPPA